ncbi:MAG: translation initiation factor IF-3 [Deltaproteobacteria bacterium]|nr:translation initiation factor IF-3 [Deltaproteobacteria bacterium]
MRPPFRRPFPQKQRGPRINHMIRGPQVRLIGSDGRQLGIFAVDGAVKMAQEEGLDLVEISPAASPPVCKVMDYGKYKYQQQKKQHDSKKHQTVVHLKEVKIRPNIDEHDLAVKIRHVRRFLENKDKAKITVQFRGREMQHIDRGREVMEKVVKEIVDVGEPEKAAKMEGRNLMAVLTPK